MELAIAAAAEGPYVVGVDLSGHPGVGDASTFVEPLVRARQAGLKLTVHVAELLRPHDTGMLLAMRPDRLGHATTLDHGSKPVFHRSIPIEACLTSNLKSNTVVSADVHHFLDLWMAGVPVCLCTDDKGEYGWGCTAIDCGSMYNLAPMWFMPPSAAPLLMPSLLSPPFAHTCQLPLRQTGVFQTTLSNEYVLATSVFGLDADHVYKLAREAVEYAFCNEVTKDRLRMLFARDKDAVLALWER